VRDLHDGAQQRLITILLALRRAADRADGEVAELIEAAARETQTAIAELRDLGSGLHPQILTNRGVAAAVESLTGSLPLVVTREIPERRWPAAVEAAAYYTIAEALTNVVKHAQAERATVTVTDDGAELVVTVADDGRGGAAPAPGRGLAGLRDRVEALGGSLALHEDGGTVLEARLPLTAAAASAPPARGDGAPASG
jgi:signal transduction histidine kinase